MSEGFEWVEVTRGDRAAISSDDSLLGLLESDDATGVKPDAVGVSMDTGSNGIMLWGQRDALLAWAEDLADRLRNGEGVSPLGEVREFRFMDRFHLVVKVDGSRCEAQDLGVGDEIPDNAGAPTVDGEQPAPEGRTWRVMTSGEYTASGYVVLARQVPEG